MKKTLLAGMILAAALGLQAKELKVLMIGNSFSICVGKFLPAIVEAEKDSILLCSAYIGGCPLQRHWDNIQKAEKNPAFKPYGVTYWQTGKKSHRTHGNVNALLKAEKWDIITIQQASAQSWKFANYEKPGAALIAYIRKHAPNARIYLQQTWSYRCDAASLRRWKMDNTKMYQELKGAYGKFASLHKLPVIPMGDAVQIYREKTPVKFTPATAKEKAAMKRPQVPSSKGDVVGHYLWRKDKKTGKEYIGSDAYHLNTRGEYMQACLWYGVLYGKDPAGIRYTPKAFAAEAPLLRACASEAWKGIGKSGK